MVESSQPRPLDPERLVRELAVHGVRYVLVDALAARLNGFPRATADADITPARDAENLERLATRHSAITSSILDSAGSDQAATMDSGPQYNFAHIKANRRMDRSTARLSAFTGRIRARGEALPLRQRLPRSSR